MESGIEMETLGQPLRFALGLDQPELLWLQDSLERHLADLRGRFHLEPPANDANPDVSPDRNDRRRRTDLSQPPSDSSWRREDDFEDITFRQRGRLLLSTVFYVLFVTVFCNGIVSVFVCVLWGVMGDGPQGLLWWGMFFFLIPFEIFGMMIFIVLVLTVLEPMRCIAWRIGRSEITCRLTWFGVGRTWTYPIGQLGRIEVEDIEAKKKRLSNRTSAPWKSAEAKFRISLIDESDFEVCSIGGLTEGEARWMADVIRSERPAWFR